VNKKSVLENLDLVLITIDETVDQGCESQLSINDYRVFNTVEFHGSEEMRLQIVGKLCHMGNHSHPRLCRGRIVCLGPSCVLAPFRMH
jgi:hypothetical protein